MLVESINSGVSGALIGVVAGGVITTGATLFLESWKSKRAACALAHAFRGELKALQIIVEKRRYLEGLRDAVTHVRATQQPYDFLFA